MELVLTWFHQCHKDFLRINLQTNEEWDLKDHLVEVVKILTVKTCTAQADGNKYRKKGKKNKQNKQKALPEEVIVVHT